MKADQLTSEIQHEEKVEMKKEVDSKQEVSIEKTWGSPTISKIAAKMVKIMAECSHVKKEGKNTFNNYTYVKESDVVAHASAAMAKNNVYPLSSISLYKIETYATKKGGSQFMAEAEVTVKFIDAESGEWLTVTFPGTGSDVGDKAIFKAITGAFKYSIIKPLMIEISDSTKGKGDTSPGGSLDPEDFPDASEPIMTKTQATVMLHKASKLGSKNLKQVWIGLATDLKSILGGEKDKCKEIAKQADELNSA